MPSPEERQQERRAFLLALYELTNADTMTLANERDVAEHLGLGPEDGDRIARSVVDQGYAEWKTKGGNMGITAYGITVAEAELSQPAPSPPGPARDPTVAEKQLTALRAYLEMIDASFIGDDTGLIQGEHPDFADKLRARLPLMRRILNEVETGLGDDLHPSGAEWPWTGVRSVVLGAIGRLETRQEEEELLGPRGPKLAAEGLHPWVWGPAAKLWDDGYRREAIQKAATRVDRELQVKVNRHDMSGDDLVKQAFSPEPAASGKPRLRLPRYPSGSKDFISAHTGAMQFGAGCMMAIRNLATHDLAEPDEQIALEQLAALSVLARWVDAAEVVTA
jgi:hypothetical protein